MKTIPRKASPRTKLAASNPLPLQVALPADADNLTQDAEWCVVELDGVWRRVRFHDYETMFRIPGLYEKVIYQILRCASPNVVVRLLIETLKAEQGEPAALRVLDLGAGNGVVGEALVAAGASCVVGLDILPEARLAAERDRPGVYEDYHVVDLTDLTTDVRDALRAHRPNCLVSVAALGFGDIPTEAFATALDLVEPGGWVAFNLKEGFLDPGADESGFASFIRRLDAEGSLRIIGRERYVHRLDVNGEELYYVALIGRKRA